MEIGKSTVIIVYCIDCLRLFAALRYGGREIFDRFSVILKLKVREATVVVSGRLRIIEVDGLPEGVDGILELTEMPKVYAHIVTDFVLVSL